MKLNHPASKLQDVALEARSEAGDRVREERGVREREEAVGVGEGFGSSVVVLLRLKN